MNLKITNGLNLFEKVMCYTILFISFSVIKRILLMLSNDACLRQYFLEPQKPKILENLPLSPPTEVNTIGLFRPTNLSKLSENGMFVPNSKKLC